MDGLTLYPMPGWFPKPCDIFIDRTIIASCHQNDDAGDICYLALAPAAPFYEIHHATWAPALECYVTYEVETFPNIIPAAAAYEAATGCWGES